MKYVVTCPQCLDCVGKIAEFPDEAGARELVRRHHMLVGHDATVTRVLHTPMEGLVL